MKLVIALPMLLVSAMASKLPEDGRLSANDRSLLSFSDMIKCMTGRSALWDYNAYGCWCGIGGHGTPVDATDRCCKTHDECWGALEDSGCRWLTLRSYKYSTRKCESSDASITCQPKGSRCARALCECDKAAAECFAVSEFNSRYEGLWNWWPGNC